MAPRRDKTRPHTVSLVFLKYQDRNFDKMMPSNLNIIKETLFHRVVLKTAMSPFNALILNGLSSKSLKQSYFQTV